MASVNRLENMNDVQLVSPKVLADGGISNHSDFDIKIVSSSR